MKNLQTDAAHLTALIIIATTYFGLFAVIIHGYWTNSSFQIPLAIATIVLPILGSAITYVGWQSGTNFAAKVSANTAAQITQSVSQGAQLQKNGTTTP